MSVRSLDISGDWVMGIGRSAYLFENSALSQQIQCRLNSFLSDCFFDIEAGLDWFNLLGSKDLVSLNLAISATILNTVGVTGIQQVNLDLNRDTRLFTGTYQVSSIYGSITGAVQFTMGG